MGCALAIVVNANAHAGNIMGTPLSRLRRALGPDQRLFVSRTLGDLQEIVAELVRQGLPPVAVVGGDGTLTVTLSALHRASGGALPPALLVLRGGTMNTVADGMGIPFGRPDQLLRRYRNRRPDAGQRRYTLLSDGQVGFLFSAGLMHTFLQAYYSQPFGTGARGAAMLLAQGIGSTLVGGPLARRLAQPLCARLTLDGVPQAGDAQLFVGAGTVPQVGLGFRPYGRVAHSPQGFHVLAYRGTLGSLPRALPMFALSQGHRVPDALDALCAHIQLRSVQPGTPIPYSLDGELLQSGDVLDLRLGPALRVYP